MAANITNRSVATTIAQTVRDRRTQLGISQVKAAKQAGISRRAWGEIENGQRHGSPETLGRMDAVLKLPKGSLAAIEVKPTVNELTEIRRELLDMVAELTTREQFEQALFEVGRIRLAALQAQLDRYGQRRRNRHDTTPPAPNLDPG